MTKDYSMNGLAGLLARRILVRKDISEGLRTAELGALQGRTSAVISLFLGLLKTVLAILTGSVALLADAINNFGDLAGSMVLIFGYRLSKKSRNAKHPYGYGRLRTIAGLVLAIILVLVGIETGKAGLARVLNPQPVTASGWIIVAVVLSIAVKAWLAGFARAVAKITADPALESEFWNHLLDIFSTGLVLVALLLSLYGLPNLDGWVGMAIAIFISYTGFRYIRETVRILLGSAPSEEDLLSVRRAAMGVAGVEGVHDIQIHEYGNMRLIILHVEMDACASAIECHRLTEEVEDVIARDFDAKVNAHGDPIDLSHPDYVRIRAALNQFIEQSRDFVDFHDLRVAGAHPELLIEVDLVTKTSVESRDFEQKVDVAYKQLSERISDFRCLELGIETAYSSDPEFRREYSG